MYKYHYPSLLPINDISIQKDEAIGVLKARKHKLYEQIADLENQIKQLERSG